MPSILIAGDDRERIITYAPGQSLRDLLDEANIRVRSGCRGSGACGLCRVQIIDGAHRPMNPPTGNEIASLTAGELQAGIRMACQVTPTGDISVRVVNLAPKSNWRRLIAHETPWEIHPSPPAQGTPDSDGAAYGVAVDLGTTNISVSLWDLRQRRRVSGRIGPNEQFRYGSDVVTRLVCASECGRNADELSRTAKASICEALLDICAREGYDLHMIGHIVIVGNTAMLSLLTGKGFHLLLQPAYWTRQIDCRPEGTHDWFETLGMDPGARVEVVEPLQGFVGSDLMAAVLATGLADGPEAGLLIDFGTNSEIALWDGNNLWVTSAAGGPAFEGSGIRCGMAAEEGAIYKVDRRNGPSGLSVSVIGGGIARGVCGSGLVDLIAHLVSTGRINVKGRPVRDMEDWMEKGMMVAEDVPGILLSAGDIDVFQRAKAAIGAGVMALTKAAGMAPDGLGRIFICGAFGQYLNVDSAMQIGLIPAIPPERVELCGNAALTGCELLLVSPGARERLRSLREESRPINLSGVPEFEDFFLENLFLRPAGEAFCR